MAALSCELTSGKGTRKECLFGSGCEGRRADVSGQVNGEHLMRGASSFAAGEVGAVESLGMETRQGEGSPGEMRQVVGDAVGEVTAPCECSSEDFLTWMEELTRSQRQTWDLASSTRSVRTCTYFRAFERRERSVVFAPRIQDQCFRNQTLQRVLSSTNPSHGIYRHPRSPCSQFPSRGGLQAGSGLAAGDRTLGEAAHSCPFLIGI